MMVTSRIAIWVIGAIGSGKSTLIGRSCPPGFRVVDQDALLTAEMLKQGLPLDMRQCTVAQMTELRALRKQVAAKLWSEVPRWRQRGESMIFEATGDKPQLLAIEVQANQSAGYLNLGVGVRCPYDRCVEQNLRRGRIVPEDSVRQTWADFERNLEHGVYSTILGTDRFALCEDAASFDLREFIRLRTEDRW